MTESEITQIVEIVTSSIVEPIKEYIDMIVDKKLNEYKVPTGNNLNENIKSSFKKELFGNIDIPAPSSTITDILGEGVSDLLMNENISSNPKEEYYGNPMNEVLNLAKNAEKANEINVKKEIDSLVDITNQDFSKFL